jgi:DNA-directed RNA polymerase subunit beta'
MLRQLRKVAVQRDELIAREKAKAANLPSPEGATGPAARRRRRPTEEAAE